jgi:hypothetical protein
MARSRGQEDRSRPKQADSRHVMSRHNMYSADRRVAVLAVLHGMLAPIPTLDELLDVACRPLSRSCMCTNGEQNSRLY